MKDRMKRKLVIFGVDGGTYDIISPLLQQGKMPAFKRVMENGCWGDMESSIPPISPVAWISICTGLNPGQHGVFGWMKKMLYTHDSQVQLENGPKIIAGRTFWEILDRNLGMRSFVMCVPMTYPAWPINGVLVAGLPGPDVNKGYVYPKERAGEFEGFNPTSSYFKLHQTNKPEFIRIAHHMSKQRTDKSIEMMRDGFDCVFFVLDATDAAQHLFWKYREPAPFNTPAEDVKKYGEVIDGHYLDADKQLGRILDEIDENTTLVVISDHGSGISPFRFFNTNHWLMKNGFLEKKAEGAVNRFLRNAMRFIEGKFVAQRVMKLTRLLPNAAKKKAMKVRHGLDLVDMGKSRAFRVIMDDPNEGITINLRGRQIDGIVGPGDYEGVRDDIIARMLDVMDPDTGRRIVIEAQKREEIYSGEKVEDAPDLILTLDTEYLGGSGIDSLTEERPLKGKLEGWSGTHRMNGIFLITGPNIRKGGKCVKCNVADVTPTVLYDMGVAVPKYMTGRVLEEVFRKEYLDKNPVKYEEAEFKSETSEVELDLSDEEKESMQEKLRNLGYIE